MVIYGAGNNLTHTLRILNNPEEYILCDKRYEEIREFERIEISSPEILKNQREKYYVLVSVYKEYPEIRELLESFGYQKEKDYCYLSIDIEPSMEVKAENYNDIYGNRIIGSLNGAVVRFFGRDSIVNVQEGFRGEGLVIDVYSDVILEIGFNVRASRRVQWKFMDGTECHIGNNCSWYSDRGELILSGEGAKCIIGNDVRFGERNVLWVSPETTLVIGNDVLFSKLITIRTNDGHPIYDLNTGECIN